MGLPQDVNALVQSQVRFVRRVGTVGEWLNGTSPSIFTITGGPILVSVFYGIITATFDVGATQLQPRITPVAGAAAAQVLSNACASLANGVINTTLVPTGVIAGACTLEVTFGVTFGNLLTRQWTLLEGTIDVLVSGADNALGALDWVIGYLPLGNAANVVVA